MRTFQAAETLLTPYQQKKKDEALAEQTKAETPRQEPESVVPEESTETAVEAEAGPPEEMNGISREEVLKEFPGPANTTSEAIEDTESQIHQAEEQITQATPVISQPSSGDIDVDDTATEDTAAEEQRLLDAIFNVENERRSLEQEVNQTSDILDGLQEQLNEATQTRKMLLDKLPESLIQIRSGNTAAAIVAETKEAAKESLKPIVLEWHQRELIEIAKGIEGLGPEKLVKLCDHCPTIGDANNQRIAAQQLKKHFADQLPRGIGKKIANELERRIIEAETKHDTPPASEQVKQNGTDGDSESREVVTPGRDPHVRLITSIARSLRATASRETLFFDECEDAQAGFEAFEADEQETNCPKFDAKGGDKNQRITQWLKGWLLAELIAKDSTSTSSEPDASEAEEVYENVDDIEDESPITKPADAEHSQEEGASESESSSSDEDIESRSLEVQTLAEKIKATGDLSQFDGNAIWADGYAVAIDELPIEACPSDIDHEDQVQWIKGWLSADSLGGGL